jgi:[ribosomal protein S5]-alanine N-acetyltransferase
VSADGAFPSLSTARLQLREIVASDAPALFAIHGDAEAMKWFGSDPPADLEAAEQVIAGFANLRTPPATGVRWGLVHADPKRGGALLGTCGVFRWNRGWRSCLSGYELARHAQGQGLMDEALRAVYAWVFETMAVERIEAQVHPHNAPSLALLKRLGFVEEGLLREAGLWLGERRDLVQLGLLRREFVRLPRTAPAAGRRDPRGR